MNNCVFVTTKTINNLYCIALIRKCPILISNIQSIKNVWKNICIYSITNTIYMYILYHKYMYSTQKNLYMYTKVSQILYICIYCITNVYIVSQILYIYMYILYHKCIYNITNTIYVYILSQILYICIYSITNTINMYI